MNGRAWTTWDLDYLDVHYQTLGSEHVMAALGRSQKSVYMAAKTRGLARKGRRTNAEDRARITQLASEGLCNRCIGRETGFTRGHIRRWRERLGLPARGVVASCVRCIAKIKATTQRQLAEAGLSSLGQLRAESYRRFAVENGWPENLTPRQVQILNVLATRGVPMTRLELARAIGARSDRMRANGTLALLTGNGPGGTDTATLLRQGLLAVLKRAARITGQGKGKSRDLYYLGPEALTILEQRCKTANLSSSTTHAS